MSPTLILFAVQALAVERRVIGIVTDHPLSPVDVLVPELVTVNQSYFEIVVPQDKVLTGEWNPTVIRQHLDRLLADPQVDLVIALGVLASNDAVHRTSIPKPLVAPLVLDPALQRVPSKGGASGVRNLTYLAYPNTIDRDVRMLYELAPFDHLAILVNEQYLRLLGDFPELSASREYGFRVTEVPLPSNPLHVLGTLPADIDAVYVTVVPGIPEPVVAKLADGLTERGLPTFSMTGQSEVALGMLAGLSGSNALDQIVRRTAVAVQDILLGAEPGEIPVRMVSTSQRLSLNVETARRLGLSPRWETLYEAELYGSAADGEDPVLALTELVAQTIEANYGLQALRHELEAEETDQRRAAAAWFPHVAAVGAAQVNDEARADASFGTIPRSEVSVGATLQQLVFADAAVANVGAQADLDDARDAELEVAIADLAHRAALAWVDVHRARALVDLRVNDVRRVQAHLEVARSRRQIGEIADAEVARFEAEIAESRRRMVDARAKLEQSQLALNQLRARPPAERFVPEAYDPQDPIPGGFGGPSLAALIDSPARFETMVEFLAGVARDSAPELRQLDGLISAQERGLAVARRAPFMPTVGVEGTVGQALYRDAETPVIEIPVPGVPPVRFEEAPDSLWSVGAQVSLPLFVGGARDADRIEAAETVASLRQRRSEAERQIDLRVRAAMVALNGSYAGVGLATKSAAAAARNLEYAEQAYARGLVDQVGLLEARNATLDAELARTDANYLFLRDLLTVERAVNRQHARMDPAAWAAFVGELLAAGEAP